MNTRTIKTYQVDVAIVGGGAAGLAAAVAVAQKGKRAVVLEKNHACGGNGLFPMGMAAVDSFVQKRLNIKADADEMFRSAMEYSHWKADPELNRVLLDRSGDTIKWLADLGVEFVAVISHFPGQNPPVYHMTAKPHNAGRVVMQKLIEAFKNSDGRILTHTRAKRLLLDESKTVCGVLAEKRAAKDAKNDGIEIKVEAPAVVVATGGFAGNDELLGRLIPDYHPEDYLYIHGARPQGDGLMMMEQAGARIDSNIAIAGGAPQIPAKRTAVSQLIARPYPIWLNILGDRFADEMIVYNMALGVNALSRQPKKTCYVILDSTTIKRIQEEGRDPLESFALPPEAEENFEKDYQKCIDDGYANIAQSLAEIAAFMDISESKLGRTINEFNGFCQQGRDARFCKEQKLLMPVKTPPYYVIRAGIDQLFTWGGVVIDHRFRVLDNNFQPIKGLYSAGNDAAGGIDGDTYHFAMAGHAFGYSVIGGRLAGEIASD